MLVIRNARARARTRISFFVFIKINNQTERMVIYFNFVASLRIDSVGFSVNAFERV